RAFGEEFGRELFLDVLITGHAHERSLLAGNKLVTAHAVVLLDDPPAFLNIATIIERTVLIAGRKWIFLAAEQESGEGANLFLCQMQIRHAQLFGFGLVLALVPDIGLGEFVFEETFLVVPGIFCGAF